MAKGEDDLRGRLQQAALELFGERGYERTTAAEIAARAGVTERTFFRHFPDKREVLFQGAAVLQAALAARIADAPQDLAPLDVLFFAIRSLVPLMEANRPVSEPRQAVIAATPALAERELTKHATLALALADALVLRGVEVKLAQLAGQTAMAAFSQATAAWLENPAGGLAEQVEAGYRELKALFG